MLDSNQKLKKSIIEHAETLGFDNTRFVEYKSHHYIVLFKKFDTGIKNTDAHKLALSRYYICSNATDKGAIALEKYLLTLNIQAKVVSDEVNVKNIALETGGKIGLNTLYYHEKFGSIISIQVIEVKTDALSEQGGEKSNCLMCLRCIKACPTNAISAEGFNRSKCLREYMDGEIPEAHRDKVYQLFSCERCQIACPENPKQTAQPVAIEMASALSGEMMEGIESICGSYISELDRVQKETICLAVKNNVVSLRDEIQKLTKSDDSLVAQYARWALDKLV